jgi:hypothetical protein
MAIKEPLDVAISEFIIIALWTLWASIAKAFGAGLASFKNISQRVFPSLHYCFWKWHIANSFGTRAVPEGIYTLQLEVV